MSGLESASVLYGAALTVGLGTAAARRRPIGAYGAGGLVMLWLGATTVAVIAALDALNANGERVPVVLAYCLAAALLIPVLAAPRDEGPGAASGALAALATVAVLMRLAAIT